MPDGADIWYRNEFYRLLGEDEPERFFLSTRILNSSESLLVAQGNSIDAPREEWEALLAIEVEEGVFELVSRDLIFKSDHVYLYGLGSYGYRDIEVSTFVEANARLSYPSDQSTAGPYRVICGSAPPTDMHWLPSFERVKLESWSEGCWLIKAPELGTFQFLENRDDWIPSSVIWFSGMNLNSLESEVEEVAEVIRFDDDCIPNGGLMFCVNIEDDRVVLRTNEDVLTEFELRNEMGEEALRVSKEVLAGSIESYRGLEPNSIYEGELRLINSNGSLTNWSGKIESKAPVSRLVITEVMANPSGTEPDFEWFRLSNDGATDISTEGWSVSDSSSERYLSAVVLTPRSSVIFSAWASVYASNIPDVEGVYPLQPWFFGGISNSGERLQLFSPGMIEADSFTVPASKDADVSFFRDPQSVEALYMQSLVERPF